MALVAVLMEIAFVPGTSEAADKLISNGECAAMSQQLQAETDQAYHQLMQSPMEGPQVPIGACCHGVGCTTFQSELAAAQTFYCAMDRQHEQTSRCYATTSVSKPPDPSGPAFVDISQRLQSAKTPEEVLALAVEWEQTRTEAVQAARLDDEARVRAKIEKDVLGILKKQPRRAMLAELVKAIADVPGIGRAVGLAAGVLKIVGRISNVLTLAQYAAPYSIASDKEEDQYLDSIMQKRIDAAFRRVAGPVPYSAIATFYRSVRDDGPVISAPR